MIKDIIDRSNQALQGMPWFDQTYGLCEQKTYDQNKAIVYWNGTKYLPVKYNVVNGLVYWRKTSSVSFDSIEDTYVSGKIDYDQNVSLRLVGLLKKTDSPNNDEYSPDRIAASMIKACSFRGKNLGLWPTARMIEFSAESYLTDSEEIIDEELEGLELKDYKKFDILIAIDFDLQVISRSECIVDPADYIPAFCLQLENYVAIPD